MSLWPLKIVVKLLLSWVPGRHLVLRRFGIFKHGQMDDISYALKIFKLHAERAFPEGLPEKFTALELGPGDSLLSVLVARGHGAKKTYLADAGAYASPDVSLYKRAAIALRTQHNLDVPNISAAETIEDILQLCNGEYLTNGLEDLRSIAPNSIDFIWSHSVLEHVRKKDFEPTMQELSRIVKKDGMVSHIVDLQDHLSHALNNLRFSESVWEHDLFAGGGFYTNRLTYKQSLDMMKKAGSNVIFTETGTWDILPTPKNKMAKAFQALPDDELRVRTYSVLLNVA